MATKKTAHKQKKTTKPAPPAPSVPSVEERAAATAPVVDAPPPLTAEPAKPRTYNNPSVGVRLNAEDRAVIVREQEAMVAEFPHLRSVLELATTLRMLALEAAAARLRAREAKAGK